MKRFSLSPLRSPERRAGRVSIALIAVAALASGWASGQTTTRASVGSSGAQGIGPSVAAFVSGDGRHVAFLSEAANLVPGDTNGHSDVFVRDLQTGATTRASVGSQGTQGNGPSVDPSISADGRYVAFRSSATNLVPGDTNACDDVFLRDLQSGVTTRASVDSQGAQGNGPSLFPSISADGSSLAFESYATNLVPGDTNGCLDVFVRDVQPGQHGGTTRASVDSQGMQASGASYNPAISADGRHVSFHSSAANLVSGDTNAKHDVFVRDFQSGVTVRASVDSQGAQGNGHSTMSTVSEYGRWVAFQSQATNLVAGDTNARSDVFVRDFQTGITVRASVDAQGAQGNHDSQLPSISADGRYAAFSSRASNLVPGDSNGWEDVFVRDLFVGGTARASVSSQGGQANGLGYAPSVSADGRKVAFEGYGTNLVPGDTNGWQDVFVRDLRPDLSSFCFGSDNGVSCPCGNGGAAGHGCENSAGTGGALLTAAGTPSLAGDTLVLTSSGELASALSIFLQGSVAVGPAVYGDGLRCVGGQLKRMYVKSAVGGTVSAPQGGEPSVSARSAALGAAIPVGAARHYQVYYRDSSSSFCPNPPGGTWNVSSGITAVWDH